MPTTKPKRIQPSTSDVEAESPPASPDSETKKKDDQSGPIDDTREVNFDAQLVGANSYGRTRILILTPNVADL